MAIEWRIFYDNGSTFSNEDGEPYDAPSTGVQVVLKLDHDNGRFLLAQRDYYWFDHKRREWFGGDIFGMFDHLRNEAPACVLFGRFVTTLEYNKCLQAALDDVDFPPKSARRPEEKY